MPSPWFTGFDDNGNPVSAGKLFIYTAGTTTKATTYSDVGLTTPNANPLILDAGGRGTVFLVPGASYKFVLSPSTDTDPPTNAIKTQDNILAVPSSAANMDVLGTAGEALTAGQAVYLSDGSGSKTAGQWYLADADFTYASSFCEVGMVPASISALAIGTIRLGGSVTGLTGLVVGTTYYVSATAGALTSTAPTNARAMGVADSTSSVVLNNPAHANAIERLVRINAATPYSWTLPAADAAGAFTSDGAGTIRLVQQSNDVVDGRLTLTTAVPVTTADVSAAVTAYYTPYKGNRIALCNAQAWNTRTFSEITISLVGLTASKPYDIFAFDSSGTVAIETLVWTNTTTRATALALQDGVLSKAGTAVNISAVSVANPTVITTSAAHGLTTGDLVNIAATNTTPSTVGSFNVTVLTTTTFTIPVNVTVVTLGTGTVTPALTRRYIGTIYINASGGQSDDTLAKRYIFNYYNRAQRPLRREDTTASWTYNSGTLHQANAATANQVEVMVGVAEDAITLGIYANASGTIGDYPIVNIGLDSTTVPITAGVVTAPRLVGATEAITQTQFTGFPTLGYHFFAWLESRNGGNAMTFYGQNSVASQSGMLGMWNC